MKKLVLVLLVLIGVSSLVAFQVIEDNTIKTENVIFPDDYSDGWEDGYCEGWKDVKGNLALCPLTPLCPLPELKCSEGYKCGYNRGFKAGYRAAKK